LDCLQNCPVVPSNTYESLISLTSAKVSITIKPYGQPMLILVPGLKEQYRQKIKVSLSKTPNHLLGLAELLIMKGNAVSARDLLAGIDFGNSSLYNYLQLQMAHLDGNYEQVGAIGNTLLAGNDLNYQRIFEVGNIFFYAKDFNRAIIFYEAILKLISPDDSEYLQKTYTNLGTCFYLNQDYQNAIVNLGKAFTYNQQDPSSLVYLGLTYRELGDKAKAIDDLTKALEYIHDPEWRQEITGIINELKQPDTQVIVN
jgi:tetratricopeptide (TPR) repeat protein